MNHKQNKSSKSFFALFFSKYFWFGLFLVLLACLIDLLGPPFSASEEAALTTIQTMANFGAAALTSAFQTFGIACMLGALFDYSRSTQSFIDFVSELLSDIVVGKTFLSKLEDNGKREALNLILRPTENQITQYSRIDDYFSKRISDSMQMWDTNFKTNLVLNIEIRKNPEKTQVITVGKMTYRIYKVKDRYEDIITTFERQGSKVLPSRLIHPDGVEEITEENCHPIQELTAGISYTKYIYEVPEKLYQYPYLTLERTIFEPGFDHWTNFHWTSLTPYDGLVFSLRCLDGLTIKEYVIFDDRKLYNVSEGSDKTEMSIISTDWLDANTGFSVTISETELE